MAVKDKNQRQPLTFLAFVLYHLLLASLLSNNPKQSCYRGGLVSEETGLQSVMFFWDRLQTSLVKSDSRKNAWFVSLLIFTKKIDYAQFTDNFI